MERMLIAIACVVAGLLQAAPVLAQTGERIIAPVGGISVVHPDGWTALPPDVTVTGLGRFEYNSPEFRKAIQSTPAPLIALSRRSTRNSVVDPTVKVAYLAIPPYLRGRSAVGVLEALMVSLRAGFADVRVLDPPAPAKVAGQPGAHMRITYRVTNDKGETSDVVSEMWIVVRGDYSVSVGAAYPADEDSAIVADIAAIAGSLQMKL